MKKLEVFFVGETDEAFESYTFHLRKEESTENIETYEAVYNEEVN